MCSTPQIVRTAAEKRSLTSHVFKKDHLELFTDQVLNYKRVAEIVNLSKADLGKLCGVARSSVRFDDKIPQAVATRLLELANIANLVAEYFQGNGQKAELWFRLPNPILGNISPRDMIRLGRYERLLNFVVESHEAEMCSESTKDI